jgi:uncharacterized Zn-finger protein
MIDCDRNKGGIIMGACVEMTCPDCHKVFIVSPSMMGLGVDFHCPFCDKYFREEDAEHIWG